MPWSTGSFIGGLVIGLAGMAAMAIAANNDIERLKKEVRKLTTDLETKTLELKSVLESRDKSDKERIVLEKKLKLRDKVKKVSSKLVQNVKKTILKKKEGLILNG